MTITFHLPKDNGEDLIETRHYPDHTSMDLIQDEFVEWVVEMSGCGWWVEEQR